MILIILTLLRRNGDAFSNLLCVLTSMCVCLDLGQHDLQFFTDANFIQLFRLCQLTVEYMLNVQECLLQKLKEAVAEGNAQKQTIKSLTASLSRKNDKNKLLKKEIKYCRKAVDVYERSCGPLRHTARGFALANDNQTNKSGEVPQSGAPSKHRCDLCGSYFISLEYLRSHHLRRHPGSVLPPYLDDLPSDHAPPDIEAQRLNARLAELERLVKDQVMVSLKAVLEQKTTPASSVKTEEVKQSRSKRPSLSKSSPKHSPRSTIKPSPKSSITRSTPQSSPKPSPRSSISKSSKSTSKQKSQTSVVTLRGMTPARPGRVQPRARDLQRWPASEVSSLGSSPTSPARVSPGEVTPARVSPGEVSSPSKSEGDSFALSEDDGEFMAFFGSKHGLNERKLAETEEKIFTPGVEEEYNEAVDKIDALDLHQTQLTIEEQLEQYMTFYEPSTKLKERLARIDSDFSILGMTPREKERHVKAQERSKAAEEIVDNLRHVEGKYREEHFPKDAPLAPSLHSDSETCLE